MIIRIAYCGELKLFITESAVVVAILFINSVIHVQVRSNILVRSMGPFSESRMVYTTNLFNPFIPVVCKKWYRFVLSQDYSMDCYFRQVFIPPLFRKWYYTVNRERIYLFFICSPGRIEDWASMLQSKRSAWV